MSSVRGRRGGAVAGSRTPIPRSPSPLIGGSRQRKNSPGSSSSSPVISPTVAKAKSKSSSVEKQSDVTVEIIDSPSSLCRSLVDLSKCPCNRSMNSWKIDCSKCHQYWHQQCVTLDGLNRDEINKLINWLCPFCYTAPVATTEIVDSSSCMTCRNTRTLRDANHAVEVSVAAANIKLSLEQDKLNLDDMDNIAGSMSMLSNEISIKCIEAEIKQLHESCQTDIRKLVNEVTELKSELSKQSSAPLQAPPASPSSIHQHDAFLKSVSDKLDAIINAQQDFSGPCPPPQASSDPLSTLLSQPSSSSPDPQAFFPLHSTRAPKTECDIPLLPHRQVPVSDTKNEFVEQAEADNLKTFFDSCTFKPENGHSVISFGSPYQYTGSKSSSNVPPIPDVLKPLLKRINTLQADTFRSLYPDQTFLTPPEINSCLINKYEGPESYLPRHSDREMSIHPESSIFTISIGQNCDVKFTEKKSGTESSQSCPDRSLYIMSRRSQEVFDHEIAQGSIHEGTRYSLTFRCISWFHRNSTCLIGDSNTRFLRFGSHKRGNFGEQMPGQKFWAPKIKDIDPVSCMGYSNVVLLCGINDIKETQIQCQSDIADCYALLKQKIKQIKLLSPCTAVFVCQLLPTKDLTLNRKVDDFNRLIHFDLFPTCKDLEYVGGFEQFACNRVLAAELSMQFDRFGRYDMLHLNRAGARVLASLIKQSIFLRFHGGVDKRRHTGKVNGRLYSNVAETRLHHSGTVDGCQV